MPDPEPAPDAEPVAWRAIVYGTPIVSSDGQPTGDVREVLGSDAEDIFHGIRIALGGKRPDVMLAADDIAEMTRTAIRADLTAAEIAALPAYDETATYHMASVGWLRKHVGWKKDAESDEEPG